MSYPAKRAKPRTLSEAESIMLTDYLREIAEDGQIAFASSKLAELASAHVGTEVAQTTIVRRCKVLGLKTKYKEVSNKGASIKALEARVAELERVIQTLVDQLGGCPGVDK